MAAKNEFSFRENSHVTKIFKKHFPNGIFRWNLAQSRIFEIKFEGKKNLFKNSGQNKFCYIHCAIMLIYVN